MPVPPPPRASSSRIAAVLAVLVLGSACGGGGTGDLSQSFRRRSGPHVAHVTPTSARIWWRTPTPVIGRLAWGPVGGTPTIEEETGPAEEHRFVLEGLTPDATFSYRTYEDGQAVSSTYEFRTPSADPGATVRFAVLGDTGTGGVAEYQVIAALEAEAPEFVLLAGDAAYSDGTPQDVAEGFVRPFADYMARAPLYVVLGNHDVKTQNGQPLLDAVDLPTNSATGDERFFSFDRGPCHIVGIDSTSSLAAGSVQRTWLEADLAANTAPWTFVYLHHCVYSSGAHGSSALLQATLVPVLDAHEVDLVFCGHEHAYERTWPLRGGVVVDAAQEPDFVDPGGTIYVITGGGGAGLRAVGSEVFTAYTVSRYHVTYVEVTGDELVLTARDVNGDAFDRMTLRRTP